MKKILVLYTGGTIGMDYAAGGLVPVPGLLPSKMERFRLPSYALDIVEYPHLIDSSAITLAHWQKLVGDLVQHYERYDGFVVIHGTDTMAYTASLLAFALRGLGKPVVLTGAQLPLVHPRSDGWGNLADALEAAACDGLAEVAVVFDRRLIRGACSRKLDASGFCGFGSPNAPLLGEFGIATRWHREHWLPPRGDFAPVLPRDVTVSCHFLMPGASPRLIGEALKRQAEGAAILMSYGNGNAPGDPALLDGVADANSRGIPVLNLTQVVHGAVEVGAYAAGAPLARAGAVSGADMTPEAALAKLTVLLSMDLSHEERLKRLGESLAGEIGVH
ncbi:asparaginase domain-containing protein [Paludibacterium paludis]|uniref:L-asparaginase 1 n=1 Tax=Paludibacterium paludis TaxID=1225769 RepID=A0A918NXD4_9NEIS|nr:asparaginase domain-containing protein [Paludibacterium paludis]GGY02751.1 L-asparaginase 1 [Paludibacterium paludis]